jgi:hypothetical protein
MLDTPEWVLALFTVVLAGATVWLARESRKDRIEQRNERERRLLRAALLEQIDNCRQWTQGHPGDLQVAQMRPDPSVARLTELLEGLSLPPDLAVFLTWARGDLAAHYRAHKSAVASSLHGANVGIAAPRFSMVDLLQEVTCLIRAHARSMGHRVVADGLASTQWEVPEGPNDRPRNYELQVKAGHRPPWPSGDAYGVCSPAQRDEAANAEVARQMGVLTEQLGS